MTVKKLLFAIVLLLALSLAGSSLVGSAAHGKEKKVKESEEQSRMQIKFVRTGGYPSGKWGCDIDTAKLAEAEDRRLHVFIEHSGILSVGKETIIDQTKKNDYQYQVSIKTGKDRHQLTIDEASLPVSYGPLIEYLERHSRDLTRKQIEEN